MRILLTRPEPEALRTAETLRAAGHTVTVAPLMRTEAVAADIAGRFAAVLMTSANAARMVAAHPRAAELTGLPVFAVGARSAQAARAAGFRDVISADGALPDLVRLVAARFAGSGERLLYLGGEDRAGDLAGDLGAHGIAVETAVIYRAVAAETLPPQAALAIAAGEIDAALHYSRRSAAILLLLAERAGVLNGVLNLAHYCLSAEVARPLREAGAGLIRTAATPAEDALLELLG